MSKIKSRIFGYKYCCIYCLNIPYDYNFTNMEFWFSSSFSKTIFTYNVYQFLKVRPYRLYRSVRSQSPIVFALIFAQKKSIDAMLHILFPSYDQIQTKSIYRAADQ